jgi:hypothetical protein
MGLGVNLPELSRNDGEPGGSLVHGGGIQRGSPERCGDLRGSSPRASVAGLTARPGQRW